MNTQNSVRNAEKHLLPQWLSAVAIREDALGRSFGSVRVDLRDLALASTLTAVISQVLAVPFDEAVEWMLSLLATQQPWERSEAALSPVATLVTRLSAYRALVDEGCEPSALRKIVVADCESLRPLLGIPAVQETMNEYFRPHPSTATRPDPDRRRA